MKFNVNHPGESKEKRMNSKAVFNHSSTARTHVFNFQLQFTSYPKNLTFLKYKAGTLYLKNFYTSTGKWKYFLIEQTKHTETRIILTCKQLLDLNGELPLDL